MSINKFFKIMKEAPVIEGVWGSPVEKERKRRIIASVAAYAYEMESDIIMEDHEFDRLCSEINPSMDTGRPVMDRFFREKFSPITGQWIHDHPEIDGIKSIYERCYAGKNAPVRTKETSEF